MLENKLDALVTPRADAMPVLAIGRYPGISVPAGFDNNGVPFGVFFGGLKGSELKLIEIAYEFEQANKNPYVKSADPCGSSTGSAVSVAANVVTLSLGTEMAGSILCPSSYNSAVGIKPTVGLTSRGGVVPISPRQDTVGKKIGEYRQDLLLEAEKINGMGELEKKALRNLTKASKNGLQKFMKENKLDALVTPFSYGFPHVSGVLAIGGFPGISIPAVYDHHGRPFAICFGGL
ncbi:putative amidase [Camellia lanceoleosa]|uniref:Amidase n=1 Tax=Camellia lanceoleosa TaxID=1840588 RepID=A0ACC0IC96_9ERIC|nr:putative amidase [Camellia lanceoleosa]